MLLLAVSGVLVPVGCGHSSPGARLIKPDVRFRGVRAIYVQGSDATFAFDVELHNPNPFPLQLERAEYEFVLDHRDTFHGQTRSPLTVPGHGSVVSTVEAKAPLRKVLAAAAVLIITEKLPYELRFTLYFSTPVGALGVPMSEAGTLDLEDLRKNLIAGDRPGAP